MISESYWSRNSQVWLYRVLPMFWGADVKNAYKTSLKKNEKTSIKTDKTKVVELIVLRISRPVALRDHFLNDVLWSNYFSYNIDFFWTWTFYFLGPRAPQKFKFMFGSLFFIFGAPGAP